MPEHNCLRLSDITNLRSGYDFSPRAAQSVIHRLSCPKCLERASHPATKESWFDTLQPAPRFLRILIVPEDILTFSERTARARLREQGDIHPLWLEVSYSVACLAFEPPKTLDEFFRSPLPSSIGSGLPADYYTRFLIYRSKCRRPDQRAQALEDLERAHELRQRGTGDPELHATLLVSRALFAEQFEESQRLVEEALRGLSLPPERVLEFRLELLQHMTCFPRLKPQCAIDLFLQTVELLVEVRKPLYRIEAFGIVLSHRLHNLLLKSPDLLPELDRVDDIASMVLASPLVIQPGRSIRHLPVSMRGGAITSFRDSAKSHKARKLLKSLAESMGFREVA